MRENKRFTTVVSVGELKGENKWFGKATRFCNGMAWINALYENDYEIASRELNKDE